MQRNNTTVGFCGMIYHDHCIQKPIVLPIYVRSIVWVFLSNSLSAPPRHHYRRHTTPPKTGCFDCSRDITKRPTVRLLWLIVESLQRFIPTLERDKENYSDKLNCLRSHTCAHHCESAGFFIINIYDTIICRRFFIHFTIYPATISDVVVSRVTVGHLELGNWSLILFI